MPIRRLFSFFRRLRKSNDERRWEEWEGLLADQRQKGGWIGEVISIRQNAVRGTKAYVRRLGMQENEAVWAPDRRLTTRTFIHAASVYKRRGTAGSHHGEEFWWIINRSISSVIFRRHIEERVSEKRSISSPASFGGCAWRRPPCF